MRYLVLSICLATAFILGSTSESFAVERVSQDGEKIITEHGHHGGWGRRGGRGGGGGWRHGGGGYYGGGYHY